MHHDHDAAHRPSVITLVRELVEETAGLAQGEARLVKVELSRASAAVARGSAFVALGAVLVSLGALTLLVGFVLLAGDQWLPADRYWLAALLATLVAAGIAAWLAKRGMATLAPSRLAPNDTVQTLKEDARWAKQQLT